MVPTQTQMMEILGLRGVTFEALSQEDTRATETAWLQKFANGVKQATGHWIHDRFRWHGFTYKYEPCLSGEEARNAYHDQWAAPFVIFNEDLTWAFRCSAERLPDFSDLRADIYVAHHNMKWTMVFTHEQPDIGPFFASNA